MKVNYSLLQRRNICVFFFFTFVLMFALCLSATAQNATKGPITLVGVGDIIIDREKPDTIFQHVNKFLHSADIAYGKRRKP
jgi:hypothetical protein